MNLIGKFSLLKIFKITHVVCMIVFSECVGIESGG